MKLSKALASTLLTLLFTLLGGMSAAFAEETSPPVPCQWSTELPGDHPDCLQPKDPSEDIYLPETPKYQWDSSEGSTDYLHTQISRLSQEVKNERQRSDALTVGIIALAVVTVLNFLLPRRSREEL